MKHARQDKMALFDLDLTLIDGNYQLTHDAISEVALRAIESGWILGLSSDTPREGMEYWQRRLGFNGSLIVEKGAAFVYDGVVEPSIEDTKRLGDLRHDLAAPLARICDRLWVGDAPGAIREDAVIGESGEEIILLNSLREFSFSLYGGTVTPGGTFSANSAVLDRAVGILRSHTATMASLDEDVNYDYGITILHDKRTNKRLGSLNLMRKLGLSSFVMVGNSMTDYVGKDIARHYAVANATKEFCAVAHVVAKTSLTEGCAEIVNILCNESEA